MQARSVAVVMPWGGDERKERRRAILNFKRVERLITSLCKVKTKSGEEVAYAVKVARTTLNGISTHVLKEIRSADILVALFTEPNLNVSYEVSHRLAQGKAMEGKLVLIASSQADLPLYLKDLPYCSWQNKALLDRIRKIAEDTSPELIDFTVGIPDALEESINRDDNELKNSLERTLSDIELRFEPEPTQAVQYLRGIVSPEIANFYPSSIVKFEFSKRYEFKDPQNPGIICDFDNEFSHLYGYVDKAAAESDHPLTLTKLMGRIDKYLEKKLWGEFVDEQNNLTDVVVKEYGFARATIPLQINEKHPRHEHRKKSYLPCIIAQVRNGDPEETHSMYLFVVYIELPSTFRVR
jgi:hypothetical protein